MQNEEGQMMDLYIPRKCSATNRLITSKDHASVQINIGHLDESGMYTGHFTSFALCGFVRAQMHAAYLLPSNLKQGVASARVSRDDDLGLIILECIGRGDADSALDRLWQKKKAEIHQ